MAAQVLVERGPSWPAALYSAPRNFPEPRLERHTAPVYYRLSPSVDVFCRRGGTWMLYKLQALERTEQ